MDMKRRVLITAGIIILLVLIFGGTVVRLYTDWLWFDSLGEAFAGIFTKILLTQLLLGLVFGGVFFAIVYFNLWLARKLAPPPTRRYGGIDEQLRERFGQYSRYAINILILVGTIFVAFIVGSQAASNWNDYLLFANAVPFGINDPILGVDIGFYVFRLPFWQYIYSFLFFTVFVAFIGAAIVHYISEGIDFFANTPRFAPGVKTHLTILLATLFFLRAIGYYLDRYELLTTPATIFFGAGYTDVHARLPILQWVMIPAAVIAGILVLLNINRRGIWLATASVIGMFAISIVAGAIYPESVEQFSVKPNQLVRQRPYIANAIKNTRQAFRLDAIESRSFNYTPTLTAQEISKNRAAIRNLRLWDYQPLQRAYNQLQVFQPYYEFADVDIDRYVIDGEYRQVMLAARELTGPPPNAQTWVNQFLRYTHGYGYAMSPVNIAAGEGLPAYFVSGIPVSASGGIEVDTPQIYFGELTNNFVLVNTNQDEFDYVIGNEDRVTKYRAESGPQIGSLFRQLMFAVRFGDINIILSDDLQPSSRILYNRNISDRARLVFPFLSFDNDPYLVTVDGRLYWFHDAYTTTNEYPYSEPVPFAASSGQGEINYIRNSVKLVTDAYTGEIRAYVSDINDPIIKVYQRAFRGVFQPMDDMPENFRSHVRYPEDIFRIQANVYSRYHMTDPSTFYSGTDLWQLPQVSVEIDGRETGEQIEPYYVITRLPDSQQDEFILIVPLIRANREVMVAWMAAQCDSPNYGQLIVYEFPRGETVFGPRQIMARANQDTVISQQLTLWGQLGSSVVRGNLLAIPIENSVLYVEPLYLESNTTRIPEFKRIIVALGNRIVMEPTLEEALAQVVGVESLPAIESVTRTNGEVTTSPAGPEQPEQAQPQAPTPIVPSAELQEIRALAQQAREQYRRAEEAQRRGDWAAYGREINNLERTLDELEQRTSGQ